MRLAEVFRWLAASLGPYRLRLRLTLLYCLMSVVSGAVLLVTMYLLASDLPGGVPIPDGPAPEPPAPEFSVAVSKPRYFDRNMLVVPGIALAILALISLVLGWLIAGRMLRPVETMTGRLRQISGRNLHERLSAAGPRTELKDLADTVDELLGRLETALDGHKRFVANAAHELRTPLTVEHALLEEPLIDPDATLESFRANFDRLLAVNDRRGRLLESLLTLSGSEHGRNRAEPVDLAGIAEQALRDRSSKLDQCRLQIMATITPVQILGDPELIERLVANLIDNAIHYNVPGGRVEVGTRLDVGQALFCIANTGTPVPPEQVDRLFEPFQRLHRIADDGHHGLGLSIVRAIAAAHGATLTAQPRPEGGLTVEVAFPLMAEAPARYGLEHHPDS
jgi:signal transduction histidine kinase